MKLTLEMQDLINIQKHTNVLYHINKIKEKSTGHFNRCRKTLEKIQHLFMIKKLNKLSVDYNRGGFFKLIKDIYAKPEATFIFNGERLNSFQLRLRIKKRVHFLPLLFNMVLEVYAYSIR